MDGEGILFLAMIAICLIALAAIYPIKIGGTISSNMNSTNIHNISYEH